MTFNPNGMRNPASAGTTTSMGSETLDRTSTMSGTSTMSSTMDDLSTEHGSEGLRAKAQHLADRASSAVSHAGERISDLAGTVRERTSAGIEGAGNYLREISVQEYVDDLSGIISRHPWPALITGLGLGLLLGRAMRR